MRWEEHQHNKSDKHFDGDPRHSAYTAFNLDYVDRIYHHLTSLVMESVIYQLEVLKDKVQDAVFALTSCICQPSATIKVNGRSFKIVRILGEGGFSFVYLAQDEHSGVSYLLHSTALPTLSCRTPQREFALKKIRCPTGQEGVKEVRASSATR